MKGRKTDRNNGEMSVPILPLSHNPTKFTTTSSRRRPQNTPRRPAVSSFKLIFSLFTVIILLLLTKFELVHVVSPLFLLLKRCSKSVSNAGSGFHFHTTSTKHPSRSRSQLQLHPVESPSWHQDEDRNEVYRPLVISGPSGVGKGTLINKLVEFYNHGEDDTGNNDNNHIFFGFSVSHTTRKPRPGEVDGVHYHFKEREEVLKDIEEGKFIEHAAVHGNLYGTSYDAVQSVVQASKICILDIDVEGAKNVKKMMNDSTSSTSTPSMTMTSPYFIFVAPPSMQILEKRLRDRGTETEEAIQKRTANAQREMDYGTAYGNFDEVLVNDDLDNAFVRLRLILEEWYPHLNQVPSSDSDFEL